MKLINFILQVKKLKNSLLELQPNGYIALHGMKGFGKSCLTASALKDKDMILNLFDVRLLVKYLFSI